MYNFYLSIITQYSWGGEQYKTENTFILNNRSSHSITNTINRVTRKIIRDI